MQNTPITMKDIAQALGVSVGTVSRALANNPSISEQRRKEIQDFAAQHNFVPNMIAGSLRNSRVKPLKIIGVILPEIVHYYFANILAGIDKATSERGYRIMVAQSSEDYEREKEICNSFYQNRVCGIILSQATTTTDYSHFRKLQEQGVPLVFYDRICTGVDASRVVVDDYNAAFTAVEYLIKTGCKRIAFYGSNMKLEISKNRFNGYRDALQKHHLEFDDSLMVNCDKREKAEELTPALLQSETRPDGFFCVNDSTAIGILNSAKRLGLRIPEDISICGFTNDTSSKTCDPMLTTVEQHGYDVGIEAANILMDQAEGILPKDHSVKRIVKTQFIVRGTTR